MAAPPPPSPARLFQLGQPCLQTGHDREVGLEQGPDLLRFGLGPGASLERDNTSRHAVKVEVVDVLSHRHDEGWNDFSS